MRQLAVGEWKAKGQTATLTIDPREADIVRERIYGAYLHGHGLSSIATTLNAAGIPAPVSDRRIGTIAWTKGTIWALLRNPIYKGTLVYAKARYSEIGKKRGKVSRPESDRVVVPDAAPAIVSAEVWAAVQAKHGTRKFGIGRPWHHPYLLSGLIVCGHCGKRFRAHKQVRGRERAYYVCGGYTASGLSVCDGLRIPLSYLETAVIDGIQKCLERVLDRQALREKLLELLDRAHPDDGALEIIERQLAERQRKIGRLVEVLASGAEDLPSVREALVGLERDRRRLEEELAAAKARAAHAAATPDNVDATVEALIAALAHLPEVLEAGEAEERKAIVRAFLQRIRIDKARRQALLTWYRLPHMEYPPSSNPLSSTNSR